MSVEISELTQYFQKRIEPFTPIFLGIHGNFMLLNNYNNNYLLYLLVNIILLLGLIGLRNREISSRFNLFKFSFFSASGLILIYLDGGVGSFFTIWLFVLSPYLLYLDGRQAFVLAIIPPVVYGLEYFVSSKIVDVIVVIQRVVVISFIGIVVILLHRALIDIAVKKELVELNEREKQNRLQFEKENNIKLEIINNKLKASNYDLEQFAFMASHDLKAPILKIQMFLNLIKEKYKTYFDADTEAMLSIVLKSTNQMTELITQILMFSQIQNEKIFLELSTDEIVNQAINNLSIFLEGKNAKISFENLPKIFGNPNLMVSLFQNIIQNGIKFNNSANPEVKISYLVSNESVQFKIADNGIGIRKEDQLDLFTMFKKNENSNDYSGSGIGLALCKKIVNEHEGTIWVESNIDQGTIFYIRLPLKFDNPK
jgi:signal transduction histidine kinase